MTIRLTREQIREIQERIERIDKHFTECCARRMDGCRMKGEYGDLNNLLGVFSLTREQIQEIQERIKAIEKHFAECCARHMDGCRMQEKHGNLRRLLIVFGEVR